MNPHLPQIPNLTLTGILDILAVAFLVYQALMVVRGTRAGHVLLGIAFMVGMYALSLWFGLEALRSLLSFIVPYLGIAIIILFQSEIRRTLARLGKRPWLASNFRVPETANEIQVAMVALRERKQGGLIVMERDIGLRTFIESGVRVDGRLSSDLLISIFHPETTLHDGAVIVQKDKIAAAACFLPLSTNPALPLNLGTRHRAAVGITEETDCLSIVVSEETGAYSIAAFGEVVQGLSLPEVDERINRHFGVHRAVQMKIDEYAADIPLTDGTLPPAPDGQPSEKVKHP